MTDLKINNHWEGTTDGENWYLLKPEKDGGLKTLHLKKWRNKKLGYEYYRDQYFKIKINKIKYNSL